MHRGGHVFAPAMSGRGAIALLIVLVLAAAAWWYFAPSTLPAPVRALVPPSAKASPTLYKWRDANGHLHVTDVAPKDRPFETLQVNPNVNVVRGVVPPPAAQSR
ncbi:MAG TPA: DUF4124 domain-containing protein [Rudaea sp.]|nr:DUF4124 domain-containing protein [Rudaea sp.]